MTGEDIWQEATPFGLRRYAEEFITVGRDALASHRKPQLALRKEPSHSHKPLPPDAPSAIYFNFLHGIELGLKAYLLHVEAVTFEDLKNSRKFGHNLCKLLTKAIDNGLCSDCPELTDRDLEVIKFLSPTYSNKRFEYIRVGGVCLIPIDLVAETADTLIKALKKLQMNTAIRGKNDAMSRKFK